MSGDGVSTLNFPLSGGATTLLARLKTRNIIAKQASSTVVTTTADPRTKSESRVLASTA